MLRVMKAGWARSRNTRFSPSNSFRGMGPLSHFPPAQGSPAQTHGSLDLGMRVPSSLILSLMLNRRRRSTLGWGGEKSGKIVNRLRREEEELGGGEAVAGTGPPQRRPARTEAGAHSMLARAHELTHSGCDCLSSVVPSKGPWPPSLEESGG